MYARRTNALQGYTYALSEADTRAKLIDLRLFIYIINGRHQLAWSKWSQVFTRKEFHRHYIEQALPLLQRWNFDVVVHGPSLHDENSYYVIRRYDSLAQREQMEDAYYASDDWRLGPRERIISLIENYTDVVFELNKVSVEGLRK